MSKIPSKLHGVPFKSTDFLPTEIGADLEINVSKEVKYFNLLMPSDKVEYESLINDPRVRIVKDNFTYDKFGKPLITVWLERREA